MGMRYVISDIHGQYERLCRLLDSLCFGGGDELYVCGDMIDKGADSVKVLKLLLGMPNAHCVMGNHELAFLNYAEEALARFGGEYAAAQEKIAALISPRDDEPLDEQTFRRLQSLPFFIEKEQFVCVHAGLPTDGKGKVLPPQSASPQFLVNDRNFKDPHFLPTYGKCVFFGHTPSRHLTGRDEIIVYPLPGREARCLSDLCKVHLDTGVWLGGVLGAFCMDDCSAHYVKD